MPISTIPAAQMSAADSASEATFLAVWLLVGAIGLILGLFLVLRANRQFKRTAARMESGRVAAVAEAGYSPAAA